MTVLERAGIVALLLWLQIAAALASDIRIERIDCAAGIRVVARDARLTEVLARLAERLEFQLHFESNNDPLITVDMTRVPGELVRKLSPGDSMIVSEARDPACPGQQRVMRVWVLPKGTESSFRPFRPAPMATPAKPPSESELMILRAHGVRDPNEPEDTRPK